MDTVNNISLPAGLSLNSAVSIIPTSPQKVPNSLPSKVSHKNVPQEVNYIFNLNYMSIIILKMTFHYSHID